jgi:predicted Zn-dependent protease
MARSFRPSTRRIRVAAALLLCATGLVTASEKKKDPSAIGDRKVSGGLNFYSIEQEIALGKQLAIEVTRQARLVDDFAVSEYINRLGQNLVRNSDVTIPVSFQVIQSDEINAFTLPGGFIFVNTGLIALSGNEAQLASALAHEIGHAAARHATRQASRSRLLVIGTLPLAALGGWGGMAVAQAARIAAPMTFLKFSRQFETEADMWKAGYDPTASIDFFEAMASTEKRQPGRVARLLRTHPVTTDRIDRTQKNIDRLLPARDEYVINTSEYEEIRQRISEFSSTGSLPILRRNSR